MMTPEPTCHNPISTSEGNAVFSLVSHVPSGSPSSLSRELAKPYCGW
ncbi:hypothetical protein VQ056_05485 [Paenibacillus sp. JTLBN-2024]